MSNAKGWILAAAILIIFAIAAVVVVIVVKDTIQRTVAPVQSETGALSTRVAEAMHPTPTVIPDPITIIHNVRSLARLETIQYTVEKVVTAETGQGTFSFLFGDKLIFVAHGTVIAGVDLSKLGPQDLVLKNNVLYVTLPKAEIFVATLDNDKSYVYNRDTGALTKGDINLETAARQVAEQEIRKAAVEDGILNQAQVNAEAYLSRLLRDLGYPEVIFSGSLPAGTPAPSLAPTQAPTLPPTP